MTIAEKSTLTGLVAGYAVHNMFVFDNLASYVMFVVVLSFTHSLREGKTCSWFGTRSVGADAGEYIVAPVIIVLLAGSLYFLNIRAVQANLGLISALQSCTATNADPALFSKALAINAPLANQEIREQLLQCTGQVLQSNQVSGPIKQAFFTLTNAEIKAQIATAPKDARMYVLGGSFLNAVGDTSDGLSMLETAHKLTPGKQTVSIQLANDYLNAGRSDEAIALLKTAYESDTTDTDAAASYATGLVIAGKESDARSIFNNDPAIFETAHMAQVFMAVKKYDEAIGVYKTLITASPTDVNLQAQLAQAQYTAGYKSQAVQTLKGIEVDHPEYSKQIDAMIKQVQQ